MATGRQLIPSSPNAELSVEAEKDGNKKLTTATLQFEDSHRLENGYLFNRLRIEGLTVAQLLELRQSIEQLLVEKPYFEEVQRLRALELLEGKPHT